MKLCLLWIAAMSCFSFARAFVLPARQVCLQSSHGHIPLQSSLSALPALRDSSLALMTSAQHKRSTSTTSVQVPYAYRHNAWYCIEFLEIETSQLTLRQALQALSCKKIAVFGATGGVGLESVYQALADGMQVSLSRASKAWSSYKLNRTLSP